MKSSENVLILRLEAKKNRVQGAGQKPGNPTLGG